MFATPLVYLMGLFDKFKIVRTDLMDVSRQLELRLDLERARKINRELVLTGRLALRERDAASNRAYRDTARAVSTTLEDNRLPAEQKIEKLREQVALWGRRYE